MPRAALYLRAVDGVSAEVDRQRSAFMTLAAARGLTVSGEFVDAGPCRTGRDELLAAVETGHYGAVVMASARVWSGQAHGLVGLVTQLRRRGLALHLVGGQGDGTRTAPAAG